ncbi:cation:proton antiporter [Actinoplanes sp. NPDC049681]|uniref:cation:proton antiporter n=1 Tax=Actinoplanes sp. NPDC049681 TaxID=3363905 RepID=UPI00378EA027
MSTDLLVTHVVAGCAIIIGLGFALGALCRRLRQPEVIGQIAAGIALGGSVLGRIWPQLFHELLPTQVVPYINVVAQVALVLFLFSVGYELDLRVLRIQRRLVPTVAAAAFVVPMLLGGGSVFAFGSLYRDTGGTGQHRGAFILFIAVALSITALPVLAGIVGERGIGSTRPAVVALATAGAIDGVGWLALTAAVLMDGTATAAGRSMLITLALFVGYVLVMVFAVRPLLLRWLRRPGALARSNVPVIVAIAMTSAWATSALGLHVIFGAFLAGLIMPRTEDGAPDADLVRPIEQAGSLLMPVFFVVAGLPVNLSGMTGSAWILLTVVCVLAMAGKLGGGYLGARLGGLPRREAAAVGAMLNTRGLTELIALNIGLQDGIISRGLYTVLVIMALVTTALTGPLLNLLRVPAPGFTARRRTATAKAEPEAGPLSEPVVR